MPVKKLCLPFLAESLKPDTYSLNWLFYEYVGAYKAVSYGWTTQMLHRWHNYDLNILFTKTLSTFVASTKTTQDRSKIIITLYLFFSSIYCGDNISGWVWN